MADNDYQRIFFELEQDEDGYPPDRWESLWAYRTAPGIYCVDNIPFFIRGISSGDLIAVESDGEQLTFKKLLTGCSNSVIRVCVSDVQDVQAARDAFRAIGCKSELSHVAKLFAIEIPGNIGFAPVAKLLEDGDESGRWEYEEGVLRHEIPTGEA